jgi:hypothetical protein
MSNAYKLTSEDGTKHVWACGECNLTAHCEEDARRCCLCGWCYERAPETRHRPCTECAARLNAERDAKEAARLAAMPVVEYDGGPVLANDTYYTDLDAALEALYDDGIDPKSVAIHPCTVSREPIPDLQTYVDEAWGEDIEDYDGPYFTTEVLAAFAALEAALSKIAPERWHANYGRVDIGQAELLDRRTKDIR